MMDFITLKERANVNGRLLLALSNKAFDNLYESFGGNYQSFLSALSAETNLLIERRKNNDDNSYSYTIHFNGYCIKCAESSNKNTMKLEGFLITHIGKENFSSQNAAMSNGVCFNLSQGSYISVKNRRYNIYEEYVAGTRYNNTDHSQYDYSAAVVSVIRRFNELETKSSDAGLVTAKEYEPAEGLDRMLTLAENYSEIESLLNESKVRADLGLTYREIRPLDYDRTDRIAYRFVVEFLKKDVYAVGTQVELQDIFGNPVSAEIINSEMADNGERYVDLLFNRQTNIESIEKTGSIRLSFSTVIKDVQQRAIERIRKNEAPAKYMDDILGTYTPKGFSTIDLSHLEEVYRNDGNRYYDCKSSFPPNPSQREAIINGIKSKDAFLVMGPPGTGKTTVILEWIKYFVLEKHMRVLVSSQNNKAVDNVLERIIKEEGIDVLRIGSEAKLQENVRECMYENKISSLRKKISESAQTNSQVIDTLIAFWENKLLDIERLGELAKEVKARKDNLTKEVNGELSPIYKTLTSLLEQIDKLQDKIQKLNKKIESRSAYEDKKNNANNPILKFVYSVIMFFLGFGLKSDAAKITELKKQEKKAISDYYMEKDKYSDKYYAIMNGSFSVYNRAFTAYCEYANRIYEAVSENGHKALGMFDFNIQRSVFASFDELAAFEQRLKAEIEKAKATAEVVLGWSQEMKNEQTYALEKLVLQNVNLVGATCIGISSQKRFAELDFDVTIIDEAGQIQIHNALVPMSLSNKLIMLGDHKQIPPSADEDTLKVCDEHELDSSLLKKSLFEFMYDMLPAQNKRMLDTQFRMPGEIADIISEWFYNGEYKSPAFKRDMPSIIPQISEKPFVIIDTSDSGKRRFEQSETQGDQTVHYNDLECEIIVDTVNHISAQGIDLSQVGIIAGLKAQVQKIKEKLIAAGYDKNVVNEMVATLDSFQGQERKIILYSFTRSSNLPPERNRIGFLTELRRINVAMSRCKQVMLMIGDMTFLSECESVVDYMGRPVEKSMTEKNFSDFIRKMLNDVKYKGRGEMLSVREFKRRIAVATEKED